MQAEARIPTKCAACKGEGHLQVRQEIKDHQLKWTETFSCKCGHGFEAAGAGLPSPGVRRSLLAQDGEAEVWLDEAKAKPAAAKVLQMLMGLTEAEAKDRLKAIPAKLYVGTRAEAAFFLEGLTQLKLPGLRLVLPK